MTTPSKRRYSRVVNWTMRYGPNWAYWVEACNFSCGLCRRSDVNLTLHHDYNNTPSSAEEVVKVPLCPICHGDIEQNWNEAFMGGSEFLVGDARWWLEKKDPYKNKIDKGVIDV